MTFCVGMSSRLLDRVGKPSNRPLMSPVTGDFRGNLPRDVLQMASKWVSRCEISTPCAIGEKAIHGVTKYISWRWEDLRRMSPSFVP